MQEHRHPPTARYALLETGGEGNRVGTRWRFSAGHLLSWRRSWLVVGSAMALLMYTAWSLSAGGESQVQPSNTDSPAYKRMLGAVLRHPRPYPSLRGQLMDDVHYIMTMYFGGQANQALAMINLLFIAKYTGRVAVLPQFTALHFKGSKRRADYIYDLARFYDSTGIIATALPAYKTSKDSWLHRPKHEVIPCWSTMEIRTGSSNYHPPTSPEENGLIDHNLEPTFWAVPPLGRSSDDYVISLGAVIAYLQNKTRQEEYVERARAEFLPQNWHPEGADLSGIDPATDIKATFDPFDPFPPTLDDQFTCVDATYFMGESAPPPPHPQRVPLDTWRTSAWKEVGQYLHFNRDVEEIADEYLMRIFEVGTLAEVPPFITIHIRRRDFKNFKGHTYTPIENYEEALAEVREKIQSLLDAPEDSGLGGRPRIKRFDARPSEYQVLVTTDENPGSPFRQQVAERGWRVIEHEHFGTERRFGEWYPAMVDGELLARGQGFVGTTWSTYSLLAGQRVEYWQGGAQAVAKPGTLPPSNPKQGGRI